MNKYKVSYTFETSRSKDLAYGEEVLGREGIDRRIRYIDTLCVPFGWFYRRFILL